MGNVVNSFESLNMGVLSSNLSCSEALSRGGVWDIYTQDGPSDDTMLVNEEMGVAITKCELFGLTRFSAPINLLPQCGWVKVGEVDLGEGLED